MNNGDDKGMKEIILVKYGEMALKGINKRTFEDVLVKNIKRRLKDLGKTNITRAQSTIFIDLTKRNTILTKLWIGLKRFSV